jgi:arginase family enzyme
MTATSAAAPALAFPASGYADDPRLGSLITAGDDGELVLVGYACDEGVRRNGGRVGAAQGPAAMRRQLPRMGTLFNPEFGIDLRHALRISDAGDIAASDSAASLEQIHAALRARVASLVARGKVPFVVGGGNDQSFANASGLLDAKRGESSLRLGVINIDAHFDVRPMLPAADPSAPPLAHSGSPFRQLLDSDRVLGRDFTRWWSPATAPSRAARAATHPATRPSSARSSRRSSRADGDGRVRVVRPRSRRASPARRPLSSHRRTRPTPGRCR